MEESKYRIKEFRGTFTVQVEFAMTEQKLFRKDITTTEWCDVDKWGNPCFDVYNDKIIPRPSEAAKFIHFYEAIAFIERLDVKPKYHYPPYITPTVEDVKNACIEQVKTSLKIKYQSKFKQ